MNKELWQTIAEDYKKARYYLYGKGVPKDQHWHRDEIEGQYYLLKAFRAAKAEEEKNHLLYARLLMSMQYQEYGYQSCYQKHKYISEAIKEYALAAGEGEKPSEKELSYANRELLYCEYMIDIYSSSDESYKKGLAILGMDEENAFNFADSYVDHFEYNAQNALLVLKNWEEKISFEFTGLCNIYLDTAPETDYMEELYCYKGYSGYSVLLHFDIGFLRIECEKIRVVKREQIKDSKKYC